MIFMKIFKPGVVFVQLIDIEFLKSIRNDIPDFIDSEYTMATTAKDSGKSFIKYETQEAIDFWRAQDWVLDYSEVKNLSLEGLRTFNNKIKSKLPKSKKSAAKLNDTDLERQKKCLQFKMAAISALYYRKIEIAHWDLPEGEKFIAPKAPGKHKK